MTDPSSLDSLKQRARQGDLAALQELRERGFFGAAASERGYPLSHAQERIWLIEQMAPVSGAYNIPQALILEGDLDVGALRQALDGLVARHESLRTTFSPPENEPRQFIHAPYSVQLREIDLSGRTDAELQARAAVGEDAGTPFDLTQGPLVRAALYKLAANRHVFALNVHHIVADAWSLGVLARDLSVLYSGYPIEPLKTQYKDFAAWQRSRVDDHGPRRHGGTEARQQSVPLTLSAAGDYWRKTLSGPGRRDGPLDVADLPRPVVQTFDGRTRSFEVDTAACVGLERLARAHGASLFMVLAALVNVLLFRHAGQQDIVIGTPVSGRDHPDLEPLVGMFVNTVALRSTISGSDTFEDLLVRIRTTALEAYEHQAYPFDRLVGELDLPRDLGRSPLFDIMLSLEHQDDSALRIGPLRATPLDIESAVAKFDLTFFFTRTSRGLAAAINYNTDLFRDERIAAMCGHLERLMTGVVANPSLPIARLEMLAESEIRDIVSVVEQSRVPYDSRSMAAIVEEHAALRPDAPAAGCGDTVLTYAELNARADGLAARLRELDLQPEECVGVLLDRSEWVAVAYLAVLKAGGAYVPIVPSSPCARTAFMLAEAGCRLVLSEATHISGVLRDIGGIDVVDVRSFAGLGKGGPEGPPFPVSPKSRFPDRRGGPSGPPLPASSKPRRSLAEAGRRRAEAGGGGLANVIYTSGSTGRPKGVLVEQRGIVRLVCSAGANTNQVQFGPDDRVLQCGSLGFDASTWEIWGALLNGGSVYFTPEHELLEPGGLRALLARHQITKTLLTPTLFNQAVDEDPAMFRGMQTLIVGGERPSPSHVSRLRRACPALVIVNAYGPTENTVVTTCQVVEQDYARDIPIGTPIANSHVVLLDAAGGLVPDGAVGEICAGGDGLARGYLGDPVLTASSFVPHPICPGERLYRTGDLGQRVPGGTIEFLGRVDSQIKLRGHRIEVGEIEHVLLDHPHIRQCVVMLRGGRTAEPHLAAYVVGSAGSNTARSTGSVASELDVSRVKDHLRASLPEVMVPSRIVFLDEIPVTESGKVDYRRLPDALEIAASGTVETPAGALEETLAAMWRDLLGVEQVGRHDSFFEVGGHSLKAVRLVARIAAELHVRLPLQDVFRTPTISGLADRIHQIDPIGVASIPAVPLEPHYACSHAQRRLWMLDRMGVPGDAYVIAGAFDLGPELNVDALSRAVDALVARHESLRTTFVEVGEEPRQVIHPVDPDRRWLEIVDSPKVTGVEHGAMGPDPATPALKSKLQSGAPAAHACAVGWESRCGVSTPVIFGREVGAPEPFDLERGPLFRARLSSGDGRFLFTCEMAHIVSDGWSMEVILKELLALYASFADPVRLKPDTTYEKDLRADPIGASYVVSGFPGTPKLGTSEGDSRTDTTEGRDAGSLWHVVSGFSRTAAGLEPLRIQYKDYAAWQNEYLAGPSAAAHREYWDRVLAGPLPVLDLPTDRARPAVQSVRGDVVGFQLSAATLARLREAGRSVGASEFMVAVALVKALLFRYTRQEDVIVGAPVALREHPDLQGQVGFYVNMLALRDRVAAGDTFSALLARVRGTVTDALEHRVYPFDRLVEELDVRRDMGRNPVFDCVVTYENAGDGSVHDAANAAVDVRPAVVTTDTSKFDLTFAFAERAAAESGADGNTAGGCDVAIEFSTDLFDRDRVSRMASHLGALAEGVATDPTRAIGSIELLSAGERATVKAFGQAPAEYPRDSSIADIFEQRVAEGPSRLAVACGDIALTYAGLNARADRLASYLLEELGRLDWRGGSSPLDDSRDALSPQRRGGPSRLRQDSREARRSAKGAKAADPPDAGCVAVLLDRSEHVPAAWLGILKAGGTYVPLDAAMPDTRLRYILANTGARLVISEATHAARLAGLGVEIVDVRAVEPAETGPLARGTTAAAYVIYTSGSTGEPKGVLVDQRAVLRLVLNTNYVQLGPDDRVLQTGSLAFDASTFEIWGPLLNGGAVCFSPEKSSLLDEAEVRGQIARHGVTTMWVTSTLFNGLVDQDPSIFSKLRYLLVGGEKLSPRHVEKARAACPGVTFINGYGPTENTTFTACWRLEEPVIGDVPIGRPVANTEILVLDEDDRRVPIGVPGEICAAGDGLACGYLGDPELTARKFGPHPFRHGDRLYRTGDIGRWRADGLLEYLGRRDRQVKLRGYRIELGEIEHALQASPGVEQAALVLHERSDGSRTLVAYVTGAVALDAAELRRDLQLRLPAYMVPSEYLQLARFPLTANGKLDYAALPLPSPGPLRGTLPTYVGRVPRSGPADEVLSSAEAALSRIWHDTLGREVGLGDNYFDLGGDSIRAIQIVGRLRNEGWSLRVQDLFTHPTIELLAPLLREPAPANADTDTGSTAPLTPVQRWFFECHGGRDLHHFNQPVMLRYAERVDEQAIRVRLQRLQDEHAALRMTFPVRLKPDTTYDFGRVGEEGPAYVVSGFSRTGALCHPPGRLVYLDEHDLRTAANPAAALEELADRLQASLDLADGPLMKAALFRLPDGDRLLIVVHHLVIDVVSWRILLDDLADESGDRPPSTDSYAVWARAMQREAVQDRTRAELPYWTTVLTAPASQLPSVDPPVMDLPFDFAHGTPSDSRGVHGDTEWVSVTLDAETTRFLLGPAHRAFGTEINDLLLTAFGRALNACHGGEATRIILEGHGRDALEADGGRDSAKPLSRLAEARGARRRPVSDVTVSLTVGWFTTLFPFLLHLPPGEIDAQIHGIRQALRRVPRKGSGYGMLRYLAPASEVALPPEQAELTFNYLGVVEAGTAAGAAAGPFEFASEPFGRTISPRLARANPIDVVGMVAGGRLEFSIGFTPGRHCRDTMEALAAGLTRELEAVADACRAALRARPWPAGAVEAVHPLSPMQEGLLFQSVYDAHPHTYVIQLTTRIRGALDVEAFAASWRELSRRHPALRSAFLHEGLARPLQVVLRDRPIEFAQVSSNEAGIEALRRADLDRGFNLAADPLMRITLVHLAPDDFVIILSHHHLVMDGWSLGIFNREFVEIYRAHCEGRVAALPPAPPYVEYVRWLESRDTDAGVRYWAEYLAGYDEHVTVPRDVMPGHPATPAQTVVDFGPELTRGLAKLAAQLQVTLNTVVSGLWALLLSRYANTSDVVFGAIVSGRPPELPRAHDMIGLFINAVPVRVQLEDQQPIGDLLRTLQHASLESEPFHYVPLAEIQQQSGLSTLFDHLVIFQNYPASGIDPGGDDQTLRVEQVGVEDRTHYDLTLVVIPGESLTVKFSYNASAYSETWIARMGEHFRTAAADLVDDPMRSVSSVRLLPPHERDAVLTAFNPTPRPWVSTHTVVDRVDAQAASRPDADAVMCAGVVVSRGQLADRANRVARYLVERHDTGPDRTVAVAMERSERLVAGILGILKAGGAYVPIEAGDPEERRRYMLQDSGAAVVLTDALYEGALAAYPEGSAFEHRARPDDLAYLIYTSGSTGRPKACQIEHRQLAHYLEWCSRHYFGRESQGTFALYSSLSFDLTVTSLFVPLVRGLTLHVCAAAQDVAECLITTCTPGSGVDSLKLTPSHIDVLRETSMTATDIEVAIVGGEALQPEQVRYLHSLNPRMRVFNEYGPTETTVGCIVHEVQPTDERVLIGRPIDNTRIYILDRARNPVPIGIPGEIYIAGDGVSRGYANRPELTAERFVPDPCGEGARAYRSGDLARWLPGGVIEHLGRTDDQVKIRGHRVELQEIEARLRLHPAVREAAVLAVDGTLVAYCAGQTSNDGSSSGPFELMEYHSQQASERDLPAATTARPLPFQEGQSTGDLSTFDVRLHLRDELPEHMVPSRIVWLERLPLTANGKIDRKALLAAAPVKARQRVAPQTPTERALAGIWEEVLQIRDVSLDDHFFELGGHSLKAMQVVSRIQRRLGIDVQLRQIFGRPRLRELAAALADTVRLKPDTTYGAPIESTRESFSEVVSGFSRTDAIQPAAPSDHYALSHAQERLWLLHHLQGEQAYNMPRAFLIEGLDPRALQDALSQLVARHEALRTAFVIVDGEPRQKILDRVDLTIEEIDVSGDADPAGRARALVDAAAIRPFDLDSPPLLRVAAIRLSPDRHVVLLVMHHIIGDGWSMNVLYREVLALYGEQRLPPLRIQYKDFAAWQNAHDWSAHERHWLDKLKGAPERVRLPTDFTAAGARDFAGRTETFDVPPDVVAAMRAMALAKQTTLSTLVLAVFSLVLHHFMKQRDMCIGMSVANRNHPDLENLIGFFVNILPIRVQLSPDTEFGDFVDQIAAQVADALEHQDYPFDRLVQAMNPERASERQPLVNVVYAYQSFEDVHIEVGDAAANRHSISTSISTSISMDEGSLARARPFEVTFDRAKFDLTLFAAEAGPVLRLNLEYDSGLFRRETIVRILDAVRQFATAAVAGIA